MGSRRLASPAEGHRLSGGGRVGSKASTAAGLMLGSRRYTRLCFGASTAAGRRQARGWRRRRSRTRRKFSAGGFGKNIEILDMRDGHCWSGVWHTGVREYQMRQRILRQVIKRVLGSGRGRDFLLSIIFLIWTPQGAKSSGASFN